ncbi:DEAD/DEAH box helicase [Clostridium tertium]|jgi:superfamily II DNA/RNA helicase|uniref:DEAD/DEAH box helicase n=1 Tax=Clostridium TaxID=1485 RepID=UPI000BE46E56|nr:MULTISPECIES: DEAD/DEAH box helicase [Clostridium]MBS5307863.1 DEAD/DEAH box helicase [Clostridium sp.]MDB1923612.1 DEAD/DEAH box helicase [Clostridium tertium]MDB1925696.1 DEAD/DEAH box helicase [Clostridium tertium]MDB1930243.1 DEAD/DEAH box helicase [Clostridium tertium]MDB1944396.1 DEAD/DEAH box helicase [Clostridium tertium]
MKIDKFENMNLSEEILKALKNLGFEKPSEVQQEVIPYILDKKDLVVKSQTGSGKTASFGIPLCELVNVEENKVKALILVPTRELAIQVKEDISNIGRLKKVRCAAIFGKQPFNEQIRELKQRVHIVCGTPGRVIDHIERGNLNTNDIDFVIIDEADKMLNMGFIDQIRDVLDKLPQSKNTALFSATIPKEIEGLYSNYMNNPAVLNIKSKVFNRDKISEKYLNVDREEKFKYLLKSLYAFTDESAIIFCNTKDSVRNLSSLLKKEKISVKELHGDMDQKDRLATMENFKNKEFKVLVATDVAARGIHINHITNVFNYEVPMEKESYVHRIGRSGRGDKKGLAISLVSKGERRFLNEIEEYINYSIEEANLPEYEEIIEGRKRFFESQKNDYNNKTNVKKNIHNEVTKIHITAGKKKKIRNIDIVGAFSNLEELTGEDIGIIDVQDGHSFVDILNGKGNLILKRYKEIKLKGKVAKLSKAKN